MPGRNRLRAGIPAVISTSLAILTGCGRLQFDPSTETDSSDGSMDASSRLDGGGRDGTDVIDSGSDPDAPGDRDADTPVRDAGPASTLITLGDLVADWATTATVHWSWSRDGVASDFVRFELVTGRTESDVATRSSSARVWTETDNPELGHWTLPNTGDADPVVQTMTDGHPAASTVFAQLVAIDRTGASATSNIASIETLPELTREIVVFADADTAGQSLPITLVRSPEGPYAGTHCYAYESLCPMITDVSCFENLRRYDIAQDVSTIQPGDFDGAFFEIAVMSDPDQHSYWSEVRLTLGPPTALVDYRFNGFTIRADGRYRLLQIPLSAFQNGPPLDYATFSSGDLSMFWVGGLWGNVATVRLDEVRIRY